LVGALRPAGQRDVALSTARAFATANPRNIQGRLLVADVLMQAKFWDRAIAFDGTIRREQGDRDGVILNNLARARFQRGTRALLAQRS
jgi:hypothetical protein